MDIFNAQVHIGTDPRLIVAENLLSFRDSPPQKMGGYIPPIYSPKSSLSKMEKPDKKGGDWESTKNTIYNQSKNLADFQGEKWRFGNSIILCGIVFLLLFLWLGSAKCNYSIIQLITNFILLTVLLQSNNRPIKYTDQPDKAGGADCDQKLSNNLYGSYIALIIIIIIQCGLSLMWVFVDLAKSPVAYWFQWFTNLAIFVAEVIVGSLFFHNLSKIDRDCHEGSEERNLLRERWNKYSAYLVVSVILLSQLLVLIKDPGARSTVTFDWNAKANDGPTPEPTPAPKK